MANEKFTPGEWRVEDYNEWDIAGVFIVDKEGNPIAKMCERFVKIPMPESNFAQLVEIKEEQEANTYLIATAPEMYRMLEQLHGALQSVPILQAEIEKVFKKARGEE